MYRITQVHYYKGYAIDKPEGCTMWNIHEIDDKGEINWLFSVGHDYSLKDARATIDYLLEEQR